MTGFAETQGSHEGAALALGSQERQWHAASICACACRRASTRSSRAARMLAGERFKRGNIQATLTVEAQEGARGLRIDPAALAAAVRIAKEIAAETGLAPARIDGLLALKGVIVQDEALALDARRQRAARDAAILESLAYAFDALAKARAHRRRQARPCADRRRSTRSQR